MLRLRPKRTDRDRLTDEIGAQRGDVRDDRTSARVADPDRVADFDLVRPGSEELRMLPRGERTPVRALAEAGQIGSDRRETAIEQRPRERSEVGARHPEAVDQDDIARAARFA